MTGYSVRFRNVTDSAITWGAGEKSCSRTSCTIGHCSPSQKQYTERPKHDRLSAGGHKRGSEKREKPNRDLPRT